MGMNKNGFYDTGYYSTKDTSLPSGSYSLSAHSQPRYSPTSSAPTNTHPVEASTFLASVRSLVAEMKSALGQSRDLEYLDYLWRTERAKKQADKQAMFRAYGSE